MKTIKAITFCALLASMSAVSLAAPSASTVRDVTALRRLIASQHLDSARATIVGNYALLDGFQGQAGGGVFCFRKIAGQWKMTGSFAFKGVPADLAARACHWPEARYSFVNARRYKNHDVDVLP